MPRGQVKWFDPKKGYGFIIGPEGQDVFVHYSHILSDGFKSLKDGQWVEYEILQGDKGWQARSVQPAEADAEAGSVSPSPAQPSQGYENPQQSAETSEPPLSSGYEAGPSDEDAQAPAPRRTSGYEGADD